MLTEEQKTICEEIITKSLKRISELVGDAGKCSYESGLEIDHCRHIQTVSNLVLALEALRK